MIGSASPPAKTPLAVSMGDPAGVGPLITWKAWAARKPDDRPWYVIAAPDVLTQAREQLGLDAEFVVINRPADAPDVFADALPVIAIECPTPQPGVAAPSTAPAIVQAIELAVAHTHAGEAAAVVTNPIAKALLYRAGFKHPGHTEFLAELDGGPRPVMMLVGGGLRVSLVTIHRPLASVPQVLTTELITEIACITDAALKRDFGFARPRLGLCGINPHAGEDGEIGDEEVRIINPAAAAMRAAGIDITDARPGDTVFHEMREGRYDAVVAMYHDQGLIPVKTLDIWGGVNTTLGLSFIRTSPDHGVAYDAAASGKARADSLIAALRQASAMADARSRA